MDEIKPVAFVAPEFEGVEFPCIAVDPEYASTRHPFGKPEFEWTPLYDQQAIDSLRSHIADLTQIIAAIPGEIRRVRAEKDQVADYLMAAADSLRKDAERYRWLRQNEDWTLDGIVRWQEGYEPINASHEVLDAAIDIARQEPR